VCLFSGEELMLKLCDIITIASRWRSQSADGGDQGEFWELLELVKVIFIIYIKF
jgi:hypothetical protein